MIKRIRSNAYYIALFLLAPFATLLFSGIAHAGPLDSWTGTDCISSATCGWSDASNWSAGVPANGDDLEFDNSILAQGTGISTDDISGLSVGTITFVNNDSGSGEQLELDEGLTVTTAITQDVSDTNTLDDVGNNGGSSQVITLGGNVTVSASDNLNLGDPGDSIDLSSNTLTFAQVSGPSSTIIAVNGDITGSGTVIYNSATTNFQLGGQNTYSGTTNVEASNLWVGNTTENDNPFGSSSVLVSTGGAIQFEDNTSTTISNPISIAGTTSGSPVTSIDFSCGSGCSSPAVMTVPNITLNGNTRFSANDPNLSVNLTGTTTNGFCVEYLDQGTLATGTPSSFTGGPANCEVTASLSSTGTGTTGATPKTPDTGLALIADNVAIPFITTTLLAGGIYLIARKYNKQNTVKR
jgi:hypothetical protein